MRVSISDVMASVVWRRKGLLIHQCLIQSKKKQQSWMTIVQVIVKQQQQQIQPSNWDAQTEHSSQREMLTSCTAKTLWTLFLYLFTLSFHSKYYWTLGYDEMLYRTLVTLWVGLTTKPRHVCFRDVHVLLRNYRLLPNVLTNIWLSNHTCLFVHNI